MIVNRDEARRVALLARLQLDESTLDRMAVEMSAILEYIEQLNQVTDQRSAVAEESSAATLPGLREDSPREPGVSKLVEANAPAWRDGFYVVPKVIAASGPDE